jgi:hypothetical protein
VKGVRYILLGCLLLASACTGSSTRRAATTTSSGSTTKVTHACVAGIDGVSRSSVPTDIVALGVPVIGESGLWTIRSALAVRGLYQAGSWRVKLPWFTRPVGQPQISARRLDGPGVFRYDTNLATDEKGTHFVTSTLVFSERGCWEVTGRYRTSSLRFRLRVGSD